MWRTLLSEWATAPAELVTAGSAVQLDARRGHPPHTAEVLDNGGDTIVLPVVPFHLDPDHALASVTTAAAPGDVSRVDTLLMISAKDRESRTERDVARERWDSRIGPNRRSLEIDSCGSAPTRPRLWYR